MVATETLHPELTADLVERVAALSPAAFESLREYRERESRLDDEYDAEMRDEIRRRLEAYERGEILAVDGEGVLDRLRQRMRAMQPGAAP